MKTTTTMVMTILAALVLVGIGTARADLLAHWTFDSDMTDTTSSWDGTATGDAAIDTVTSKIGGGSVTLDGTGDHVEIGELDLTSGAVTLSAWVYMTSQDGNSDMVVGKNATYHLGVRSSNRIWAGVDASSWASTGDDGLTVPLNTWTHVAMTYDGSNIRRYLNGVETGTAKAVTGNIVPNNTPLRVGFGSTSGTDRHWDGNIDDAAVWNEALSAAQILQLYTDGLAGKNVQQSLYSTTTPGTLIYGK